MFQGRETVVEHLIGNIKLVALVFRAMDFVFQQFQSAVVLPDVCHTVIQRFLDAHHHLVELFAVGSTAGFLIPYPADSLQFFLVRAAAEQNLIDGIHLVYGEAIAQDVAIIQQIVSQRQLQQEEYQEHHRHILGVLGNLHRAHVFIERIVGAHLSEELGVDLVVAGIQVPLVERQGCHSTLVADIENHVVVGWQTVSEPLQFSYGSRLRILHHQEGSLRSDREIMAVEILSCRIGEGKRALVMTVDIAEISAVGILVGSLQIERLQKGCTLVLMMRAMRFLHLRPGTA